MKSFFYIVDINYPNILNKENMIKVKESFFSNYRVPVKSMRYSRTRTTNIIIVVNQANYIDESFKSHKIQ